MKRKVKCALCHRDYPSEECEQSIRGWECNSCLDKKMKVAIRKMGNIKVDQDGSYYMVVDDNETDAS